MSLSFVKSIIFSEKFWLPSHVSWSDYQDVNITFPDIRDFWMWIPVTGIFLLCRWLWERYIAYPVGRYRGVSEKRPRQPKKNVVLEAAFKRCRGKNPDQETLTALWKQTDMSTRHIERWWRRRKTCNNLSDLQKLGESSWRCLAYSVLFFSGLYLAWGEPYLWDTKYCWYDWPKQNVTSGQFWYYCLQAGFYLSLLVSAATDTRRKDFWEMTIHHMTVMCLLFFSWLMNIAKVGVLMLVMHDVADPLLDLAKFLNYLKIRRIPNLIFVVFTVMWLITRLLILPAWIGYTAFFEAYTIIGFFPAYALMTFFYILLQILHLYWFTFILKVLHQRIILKQEIKDVRSDTESDSETDEEAVSQKHHLRNGLTVLNGLSKTNGYLNGHLNGHISNGHISNGHISNGHISNGHISNGHISNGHISNAHISNAHISNGLTLLNGHIKTNGHILKNGSRDLNMNGYSRLDAHLNGVLKGEQQIMIV